MNKTLFIALLLCAVACEEPNYQPATKNVNEYILKDEFNTFVRNTMNQFENFESEKDLDTFLKENGSKYQNLDNYQGEIYSLKLRYQDYLMMQAN